MVIFKSSAVGWDERNISNINFWVSNHKFQKVFWSELKYINSDIRYVVLLSTGNCGLSKQIQNASTVELLQDWALDICSGFNTSKCQCLQERSIKVAMIKITLNETCVFPGQPFLFKKFWIFIFVLVFIMFDAVPHNTACWIGITIGICSSYDVVPVSQNTMENDDITATVMLTNYYNWWDIMGICHDNPL